MEISNGREVGRSAPASATAESAVTALERPAADPAPALGTAPEGEPASVAAAFRRQVARTPDAVAIDSDSGRLSYGELYRRAVRLARRLRRVGVGPDLPVGVVLERSPELIVALVAIVEAGGAYVAFDPADPDERLAEMLADAAPVAILSRPSLAARLPPVAVPVLDVGAADEEGGELPAPAVGGEHLIYLSFTSGSSGRPKGVAIPHRGVLRLLLRGEFARFGPDQAFLQLAPVAFDASTFEIWGALLHGARLVVAPPGPLSVAELSRLVERCRVTTLWLTAGLFHRVAEDGLGRLGSLRQLLAGGDVLSPTAVARAIDGLPGCRVINGYGPTECTTFACCRRLERRDLDRSTVPIGEPIADTVARVLGPDLTPAPAGEPGELYLGGAGLARGYHHRPGWTAERFVPDPLGPPGARLYRTGDRARWSGGTLEFLGRFDDQVKLRGYRVEPGEVTAVVGRCPGVAQAVVAVAGRSADDRRLVAYLTFADGAAPTTAELRSFAAARLPDYMVPAAFVPLARFPLTANGKVDRAALARLAPSPEPPTGEAGARPATPVGELVAAAWADVLGGGLPGLDDDFLAAGGHSLLAMRLVARLRDALGVELPLVELYERPTLRGLAESVEARLAGGGEGDGESAPRFVRLSRTGELPLSPSQQRVWFVQQLEPGNLAYSFQATLRFRGALRIDALAGGLAELLRRHEIFRTTYPAVEGRPRAVIHPIRPLVLPKIDLAGLPPAARERAASGLAAAEFRRPFDLGRLPLVRWTLLRLGARDHLLLHVEHHIVHDGWSFNVLLAELAALYRAAVAGARSPLPEPALQFVDFAAAQRAWLAAGVGERQLAWWRRQLADCPEALDLPFDRPRSRVPRFRGGVLRVELPAVEADALRRASRRAGATHFMILLAGLAAVLHRWSRQPVLALGTGVANRRWREVEGLVGMVINNLVLRLDCAGNPSFGELLARVRATTLAAYAHQDVPFDAVVSAVRPQREAALNPLFQAMFSFHDSPGGDLELPEVELEVTEGVGAGAAKFDLNVIAIPHAEQRPGRSARRGVTLVWEYNRDLFDAATMKRMLAQLRTLLAAAARAPETELWELPLLPAAEVDQIVAYGRRREGFPVAATLDALFAAHAAAAPDAIALVAPEGALSYGELDRRSGRVAAALRRLGAGPEVVVGLACERSADLVVGLLGILKSGAAYLPLDPALPPERLALLADDAGVRILVSHRGHPAGLPTAGRRVLDLGGALPPAGPPAAPAGGDPARLAYVIYTSGSTGRPKGVLVTHANAVRLLTSTAAWFGFGPADHWTLFHSFTFDFSVWEIWGALAFGGRLVVVPYEVSRSPEAFRRLLAEEGVTVLNQTPSAFRQLVALEERGGERLAALAWVIFGGEALEPAVLAPWFARYGDRRPRLVNMYGITETTVHVTFRPVVREDLLPGRGSRIGVPLPDLALWTLDPARRPAPIGVPGELCVGGAGVARGYLGRPRLTAERFVPDPLASEPGGRLYRSGDLARSRADGDREYLGRIDQQVKVRGFRVEPGEIEAALGRHPAVAEAAVLLRADRAGDGRLVAWVVAVAGGAPPAAGELRRFLAATLPDYMVPAAFVPLAALPLTANGKLDRRALPDPGPERPDLGAGPVIAADAEEEVLAAIWAEVLGLEEVGVEDNYFALGGDSIRAIEVLWRARRRGLDFDLVELFDHQTVRSLARRVRQAREPTREALGRFALLAAADRAALPADLDDAYPATRLQTGMLFHGESRPGSTLYHDLLALRVEAPFAPPAMARAARRWAARHEALRTSFDLAASEPLQRVHREVAVPLAVVDLRALGEPARAAAAWFAAELGRPFDWAAAPLVRLVLLRHREAVWELGIAVHHAILDGWSLASAVAELLALYLGELGVPGVPEVPPVPAVRFADFVVLEREALAAPAAEEFWRLQVRAAPETRLPRLAPPALAAAGTRGHLDERPVPAAVAAGLRRLARAASAPLRAVLLAAHLRLLAALTGEDEVTTGLTLHGRPEREGGERVLGLFLNVVPFRLRLAAGSWTDLVIAAFAHEREVLPFRRYPLAAIERLAGRPLFDTAFNFAEFHVYDAVAALPALRLHGRRGYEATNFALLVNVQVVPGDGALRLRLISDPGQVAPAEVAVLGERLLHLLEAMAADPDAPWEGASLLTPAERVQVLDRWSAGAGDYPRDLDLAAVFAAQAAATPDAIAVSGGGVALSYGELARRANRLAGRLRRLGVGPEVLVGVSTVRSVELLVALVAILAAGGAYVPLDPGYPAERLAFMAADTGLTLVLTGRRHAATFAAAGARPVVLDEPAAEPAAASAPPPWLPPNPDRLIYVTYTSGSTGRPKGVAVRHLGVLRLVLGSTYARLGAEETLLLGSPLSFDVSTFEIWGALGTGGRLAVPPPGVLSIAELGAEVEREGVTTLWLTAALFQELGQADLDAFRGVRQLLAGGDAVSPAAAARVLAALPSCRLIDGYGPTECTTFASTHPIAAPVALDRPIPIGRPIAGTALYVVDRRGRPVPPGVAGELLLGGDGVARGYLGRPALTAERFVPDPFSGRAGARLYRTGDRARWLAGGVVEFLGRLDRQVKVRGFRVEPGEVEAALAALPGVAAAAVVARPDATGGHRLVAYVVPAAGAPAPTAAELRADLGRRLPAHLVPGTWVELPELPLTAHGKLDRRALPAPEEREEPAGELRAPRTPLEQALAELWAEILGRERVGIDDDFFASGGHSLLAIRLVARVRAAFGVDLPLSGLLAAPTVAAQAAAVAALGGRGGAGAELPVLTPDPAGRHLAFPLTAVQEAYWVGRGGDVSGGGVAAHLYVEVEGERIDAGRFAAAWRGLIARHDMLRAVVLADGTQRVLAEVPDYQPAVADLDGWSAEEVEAALAATRRELSHQVFAADRWPLFDLRLTQLPGGRSRLHLSLDALLVDAWSLSLLSTELADRYDRPEEAPPPLALAFRDYVLAERSLRAGAAYRRAESYWLGRLDTLPPPPELPLAANPQTLHAPRFGRRSGGLDRADWRRLQERARRAGLSPSATLLAAWSEVLAAWSKSPRFTLCLTLFQRLPLHPEVDRLVGDFTSLTLLEVDAARSPAAASFEQRARRLRDRLWDDLDHRLFGGVQVLRELNRRRGPGAPRAATPVVFTSTLGLAGGGAALARFGERVFALTQTPQVWLDHQVLERDGELVYHWDAVEGLFPAGLVDDLFAAYRALLARLVADEDAWSRPLGALVPPSQLALFAAVNDTRTPASEERLDTLFAATAAAHPERPAVVAPARTLTYGELARRAGALAWRLRRRGAGPGRPVAVVLAKGWEQAVAVVGILQAGAPYLPVDPDLPAERLRTLLARGEAALAVTLRALGEGLAWSPAVEQVWLDEDDEGSADAAGAPPAAGSADDLAYVLFTSGSTGVPKGVAVAHRGAVNTVVDVNRRFGIDGGDRVLGLSSLSFDLSVWDLFGTFAAGGTLVLPAAEGSREPAHWAERLASARVTVWNSVPALLELLVEHAEQNGRGLPAGLRRVLLSGDWIPVDLPGRLRRLVPGAEVIGLGGATEASIWSIFHRVDGPPPAGCRSVPYGRPLGNQTFHVLDDSLEPRPVWVPGQLYIGGAGLAAGYWRDAEATAASFVRHPPSGERLYRTGDLGRRLPDGEIEFLGREDGQVKIHGFRVELGEVEAHLATAPGVRAAAVAACGPREGRSLVGYVVAAAGGAASAAELRAHLGERLPAYMVPERFVVVGALPLTANGKVDRKALPAPSHPDAGETGAAAPGGEPAAADPMVARVGRAVAAVLGRELEPAADLLAAGADSVAMVRIANRIERDLGFRPGFDQLYEFPTVAGLAELARRSRGGAVAAPAAAARATLLDPADRKAFVRGRPGLRRDPPETRSIPLPGAVDPAAYRALRSFREFTAEPIPLARFGHLLAGLVGRPWGDDGVLKYLYPSAGGAYPVQVYLHVQPGRVESLAGGTYYHHPVDHRLVELAAGAPLDPAIHHRLINRPIFERAAFSIFLVARTAALVPLYGDAGLGFAALEAGYLGQLLRQRGAEVAIGLCPIGDVDFARVRNLFDLAADDRLVHSLLGGAITADQPWEPPDPGGETAEFAPTAPFEEGEL